MRLLEKFFCVIGWHDWSPARVEAEMFYQPRRWVKWCRSEGCEAVKVLVDGEWV